MENGIEESADRSSSPTPFLGFSPGEIEVKKEILRVPDSPAVRVSHPRTTKSRASLAWQKSVTIKEEPADEESCFSKPVMKEKVGMTTPTKQKSMKTATAVEKHVIKTVKVEKDEKVKNDANKSTSSMSDIESVPSTSTENGEKEGTNSVKKRRPRKNKTSNKKGFKCNQCGRVYKYLRGMRQHQKLECNKEPQFPCPYCPNRFRYRQGIREHVRVYHEQAFPKWYATHYVIPMLKQENFTA